MVLKRIGPVSAAKIAGTLYAIMGFVFTLIGAAIYNGLARVVGGVVLEFEAPEPLATPGS
jgi:hypothetical protein